jgi:flavin reductase (DIM6/NTAB) family NADH-FMN oxidoreductase RutF
MMKKTFLTLMIFASMTASAQEVKNVDGRTNFNQEALITPMPAIMIATYDQDENPDVMMAAWGGQCGPRHICFNLSAHKTTENLQLKKAFTVSFADQKHIAESDYFGMVSAKDVPDKVKKAGFTVTKSPNVDAPIINEYPLTLECKVIEMTKTSLNETRVVGEVINMSADDSVLTNGRVDLDKLQPVVFDASSMSYRAIGDKVAGAWNEGNKIASPSKK